MGCRRRCCCRHACRRLCCCQLLASLLVLRVAALVHAWCLARHRAALRLIKDHVTADGNLAAVQQHAPCLGVGLVPHKDALAASWVKLVPQRLGCVHVGGCAKDAHGRHVRLAPKELLPRRLGPAAHRGPIAHVVGRHDSLGPHVVLQLGVAEHRAHALHQRAVEPLSRAVLLRCVRCRCLLLHALAGEVVVQRLVHVLAPSVGAHSAQPLAALRLE